MPVAKSRSPGAAEQFVPPIGAEPAYEPERPSVARLADDQAVPTASPVHRLQAGLAQLIPLEDARSEGLYPGWIRLTFPLGTSVLLWGVILWGVGMFA